MDNGLWTIRRINARLGREAQQLVDDLRPRRINQGGPGDDHDIDFTPKPPAIQAPCLAQAPPGQHAFNRVPHFTPRDYAKPQPGALPGSQPQHHATPDIASPLGISFLEKDGVDEPAIAPQGAIMRT